MHAQATGPVTGQIQGLLQCLIMSVITDSDRGLGGASGNLPAQPWDTESGSPRRLCWEFKSITCWLPLPVVQNSPPETCRWVWVSL